MSLIETFQMAVQNILSSKMRTFLTMLGIIIGVCAVIVIVGLGNGMQGYIEDSFADMGTDSLTVMVMGRGSSRSVSEGEMYQLVADNSDVFKQISPHGHHERLGEDRQQHSFRHLRHRRQRGLLLHEGV